MAKIGGRSDEEIEELQTGAGVDPNKPATRPDLWGMIKNLSRKALESVIKPIVDNTSWVGDNRKPDIDEIREKPWEYLDEENGEEIRKRVADQFPEEVQRLEQAPEDSNAVREERYNSGDFIDTELHSTEESMLSDAMRDNAGESLLEDQAGMENRGSSDFEYDANASFSRPDPDSRGILVSSQKDPEHEVVNDVQSTLANQGYNLGDWGEKGDGVDGVFGEDTAKAVRQFQVDHDLEPSGLIDQPTLNAIEDSATNGLGRRENQNLD